MLESIGDTEGLYFTARPRGMPFPTLQLGKIDNFVNVNG